VKSLMICDKLNILAHVDAPGITGLPLSTLNTIVKNHKAVERIYILCGHFS
jgi:hypothetical protein